MSAVSPSFIRSSVSTRKGLKNFLISVKSCQVVGREACLVYQS